MVSDILAEEMALSLETFESLVCGRTRETGVHIAHSLGSKMASQLDSVGHCVVLHNAN